MLQASSGGKLAGLRFNITIRGGSADAKHVDATTVAEILRGVAEDIKSVCRNTLPELTSEEVRQACRLFVAGEPDASHSLAFPCQVGVDVEMDALVALGSKSADLYFDGIEQMGGQDWEWRDGKLPDGFDADVIEHVQGYYKRLEANQRLSFDVQRNGVESRSVPLSENLRKNVEMTAALLRQERPELKAISADTENYSVQGVMYGLEDHDYSDESAPIKFEVDPHDGTHWVCEISREIAPKNLGELWKSVVLVEGRARFRPQKPQLAVERFTLIEAGEPAEELEKLRQLAPDLMDRETSEQLMSRLRGGDEG